MDELTGEVRKEDILYQYQEELEGAKKDISTLEGEGEFSESVSREGVSVKIRQKLAENNVVSLNEAGIKIVGGGGRRTNAGRKSQSSVPWKSYKKIGKREAVNLSKENKSIKNFFAASNKVEVNDETSNKQEVEDDPIINNKTKEYIEPVDVGEWADICEKRKLYFVGQNLQYFKNGCFAKQNEKLGSGSNFSCAIDTFINMGEAVCLSGNYIAVKQKLGFSPLLQEVLKVLLFRIENNFS